VFKPALNRRDYIRVYIDTMNAQGSLSSNEEHITTVLPYEMDSSQTGESSFQADNADGSPNFVNDAVNAALSLPYEDRLQHALQAWRSKEAKSLRRAAALWNVPRTTLQYRAKNGSARIKKADNKAALQHALEAWRSNEVRSLRKAAQMWNVPRTTLQLWARKYEYAHSGQLNGKETH
jgi:transcriptional regulator with PAS, ATPase and Fis domain